MTASRGLSVDLQRLQRDVDELAGVGRGEGHGIYRMAFSDGDMAGRAWLESRIKDAGLAFHADGAANLHGVLEAGGDAPHVLTGSHIDTIPGAGHLDGALGVLCGLEALRALKESGLPLKRGLEVVAFSDEEGRFGGMFGSQAFSGQLTPGMILEAEDADGVRLVDAMQRQGLNAMDALRAQRAPGSVHAFVELHIEQGPVLDRSAISIGVVEAITGLFRWDVVLSGAANHAGTTPMDMRQDAFQGLAEFASQLDRVLEEEGGARSVATIGHVSLSPGAANVVPGEARFILEVRDTDSAVLDALARALRRTLSTIARRRGLMFEFSVVSEIAPVPCDAAVMAAIEAAASELEMQTLHIPSGAAHDTQMVARVAPAGMIFVPSKEGRSHSPAEWTAWDDIEKGANVLLNTLYKLAC